MSDRNMDRPIPWSDQVWDDYYESPNETGPGTAENGDNVDLDEVTDLAANQIPEGLRRRRAVDTANDGSPQRERWRVLLDEYEKSKVAPLPFKNYSARPTPAIPGSAAPNDSEEGNLIDLDEAVINQDAEHHGFEQDPWGGTLTEHEISGPTPYPPSEPFPSLIQSGPSVPMINSAKRDMTHSEDRQYSQYLLHKIQNELSEGDTLIFVDFPAPVGNAADNVDCSVNYWDSVQFRMDSKKLLGTGSSKFADMLNPSYQFRIQRRRKLVNKLPEGVKFVLDLTPPSEGDDLVFQMTEVSLTPGIINWWTAGDKHGVDDYVVRGHDDICCCWRDEPQDFAAKVDAALAMEAVANTDNKKPDTNAFRDDELDRAIERAIAQSLQDSLPEEVKAPAKASYSVKGAAARLLMKKSTGETAPDPIPTWRQIPDYCPVRHRVNILRLMCIIADKRVLLDSAPRVWTLVAVAKILDCTDAIRDQVLQWLMSPSNTVLVEVLPEESLQIGVALKLDDITQCAFRVLVNELAIEEAAAPNGIPKAAPYTVFGRRRHDPGDDLNNLIQHAARAMVERVTRSVRNLTSPTIYDDLENPQWTRLQGLIKMLKSISSHFAVRNALAKATELSSALENNWKSLVISEGFNQLFDGDQLIRIDDYRATYVDVQHFHRFELIYNQFNDVQKALCPFVYESISKRWGTLGDTMTFLATGKNLHSLSSSLWYAVEIVMHHHPEFRQDPTWQPVLPARAPPGISLDPGRRVFNVSKFEQDLKHFLRPYCYEFIRADFGIPMFMSSHLLLNLTHNEFKFLPLWAGGNDDGTGGVFEPSLPPADYGPAGPGPAYHTGATIPSDTSSVAGSMSSELRQLRLDGGSTVGPGSVDVQDGISTVYGPNRVIADDVSIHSESFTDGGSEFAQAKYAIPADGQSIGDAVERLVLDETPDQSDTDASFGLDNGEEDDDMDDIMTEIGPEDSRSREATPEPTVEVDTQSSSSSAQPTTTTSATKAPFFSDQFMTTTADDSDDDMVLI
ncbi:hypothetical protein CkaCkLH20_12151 [Colletotrichum karsti]|uniref:Uncharacterized protein n=1 Tax=Colletotrichum karsti TaxID=1095194 RepID=A0A9P6HU35_9PEZI|nr:uncharacterized protein CkaCkLH20_12151 [Colletotrichum karsti]KAF9870304.1 hypothetical protein CkaCkLH20_12151 [Colletotrichum karsti]